MQIIKILYIIAYIHKENIQEIYNKNKSAAKNTSELNKDEGKMKAPNGHGANFKTIWR